MNKITPFLWFDGQAEEAARLYVSLFKNSKIGKIMRMPKGGPGPEGSVLTISFELDGQPVTALNGGPHYKLTEAFSFVIHCKDQAEIDHFWNGLLADGGVPSQCGWLKDRFGVSWQVTPDRLLELMADKDPAAAGRVMQAAMRMGKFEIATLEAAAKG